MELETKRIRLRALEPNDLELLFQWENNMSIWESSNTITPFSKDLLEQYLGQAHHDIYTNKQLRLIIERKDDRRPLGTIDLFDFEPRHRRAGVGILIADEQDRKQGFAKEALAILKDYAINVLGLHQLHAHISEDNTESLGLFLNAGFIVIGTKKDWLQTGVTWKSQLFLQFIPNVHA